MIHDENDDDIVFSDNDDDVSSFKYIIMINPSELLGNCAIYSVD